MFGNLMGKKVNYGSETENDGQNNGSMTSPILRNQHFLRHDSKLSEIKMQRAVSLLKDADYEETELQSRHKPEYEKVKFVVFPDDNWKIV